MIPLLLAALAFTCPAGAVRTDAYAGEPPELDHTAWVATSNGAFAGHLFYWSAGVARAHGRRAAIFVARPGQRERPKVLWVARRATAAPTIAVTGERLDAPGRFRTVAHGVGGSAPQFPSYVEIPRPGCWRVTVTAGRLTGSIVFDAFAR